MAKSEGLFGLYYPTHSRTGKKDDYLAKVMHEVTKQLFSNELTVIAGLTNHYQERMEKIRETAGRSESSPVKPGARKQAPPVYRNPIFLNNPNWVKRKRLLVTKNAEA